MFTFHYITFFFLEIFVFLYFFLSSQTPSEFWTVLHIMQQNTSTSKIFMLSVPLLFYPNYRDNSEYLQLLSLRKKLKSQQTFFISSFCPPLLFFPFFFRLKRQLSGHQHSRRCHKSVSLLSFHFSFLFAQSYWAHEASNAALNLKVEMLSFKIFILNFFLCLSSAAKVKGNEKCLPLWFALSLQRSAADIFQLRE